MSKINNFSDLSKYNKFLIYHQNIKPKEEKDKEKYFKTKILKPNEYSKCDICGERIKIDELSIYFHTYDIGGHYNHIIEFIESINLIKEHMPIRKLSI